MYGLWYLYYLFRQWVRGTQEDDKEIPGEETEAQTSKMKDSHTSDKDKPPPDKKKQEDTPQKEDTHDNTQEENSREDELLSDLNNLLSEQQNKETTGDKPQDSTSKPEKSIEKQEKAANKEHITKSTNLISSNAQKDDKLDKKYDEKAGLPTSTSEKVTSSEHNPILKTENKEENSVLTSSDEPAADYTAKTYKNMEKEEKVDDKVVEKAVLENPTAEKVTFNEDKPITKAENREESEEITVLSSSDRSAADYIAKKGKNMEKEEKIDDKLVEKAVLENPTAEKVTFNEDNPITKAENIEESEEITVLSSSDRPAADYMAKTDKNMEKEKKNDKLVQKTVVENSTAEKVTFNEDNPISKAANEEESEEITVLSSSDRPAADYMTKAHKTVEKEVEVVRKEVVGNLIAELMDFDEDRLIRKAENKEEAIVLSSSGVSITVADEIVEKEDEMVERADLEKLIAKIVAFNIEMSIPNNKEESKQIIKDNSTDTSSVDSAVITDKIGGKEDKTDEEVAVKASLRIPQRKKVSFNEDNLLVPIKKQGNFKRIRFSRSCDELRSDFILRNWEDDNNFDLRVQEGVLTPEIVSYHSDFKEILAVEEEEDQAKEAAASTSSYKETIDAKTEKEESVKKGIVDFYNDLMAILVEAEEATASTSSDMEAQGTETGNDEGMKQVLENHILQRINDREFTNLVLEKKRVYRTFSNESKIRSIIKVQDTDYDSFGRDKEIRRSGRKNVSFVEAEDETGPTDSLMEDEDEIEGEEEFKDAEKEIDDEDLDEEETELERIPEEGTVEMEESGGRKHDVSLETSEEDTTALSSKAQEDKQEVIFHKIYPEIKISELETVVKVVDRCDRSEDDLLGSLHKKKKQ